jgi:voltage-gated potassium channel Kch
MASPRRRTARLGGRAGGSGHSPGPAAGPFPGEKPTLRQRFRYRFDNTMSRGTPALVAWLGVITVVLVGVFTLIVLIGGLAPKDEGGDKPGIVGQAFKTMLHALDPGTVAGDTGRWPFLIAMFGITIAGLFVVSALIGVIATGLDNKIQELRKGRSYVLERDHTLILGWSETVYTILSELAIANESEADPIVVILSELDRVEMEDLIRNKVGSTGRTRVVCRSGSPIDLNDLAVVNPQASRSIIVLSPDDDDPDAQVIKTVLALTRGPGRRDEPYLIVAEIEDPKNLEAARLVGGDETVLVDKSETISRLIVQASRQAGLSAAYTELLDFDGDEIYFREDPALVGWSFGDALHAYEDCAIIGTRTAAGAVRLNPPAESTIEAGDQVIAIASDDAQLLAASAQRPDGQVDESVLVAAIPPPERPMHSLILGWNRRAATVINELDEYVPPGSTVTAVADWGPAARAIERECAQLANLTVDFREGDTTERRLLDSLEPQRFDHVIVLCYADVLDAQRADARTLVTLLHLRDIASKSETHFTVTSEMLDDRNRQLAEVTRVDDVIVSDKLISLLLTQLSENPHLSAVFEELFAARGSELYMRPAADYVRLGEPVDFRTLIEAARRRGEVAVGFRAGGGDHGGGVVRVNPAKSEHVALAEADRVIVLAEQ